MTDAQTDQQTSLFQLPTGWIWVQLEDLVLRPGDDIVDGPFGSNLKASEYVDNGIPIIRLQNIGRNVFVEKNIRYISLEKARQLDRHNFSRGDIVITKLGAPLGKACLVPQSIERGIIVADVVRLRIPEQFVSKKYLVYAINSEIVVAQLKKKTKGTTRPRVNLSHIRKLAVPIAPMYEQHRIVGKVEALFACLDAGVEGLRKVKVQLKRYRQAVLKYAFEGKLTEEWRKTHRDQIEPAIELLERVKHREARSQEPLPIEESDLFTLPEDWAWTAFGEISQINMGQSPSGSSYNNSGHGTPLLNGPTEFGEEHPIAVQWTTSPTKICKKGDLLICVRGNTTGRMNWADQEYCIGRGLAAITPLENIVKCELLFSFLLMKVEEIMRRTRGSTFPNLKSDELHKFPFPLAPYAEQEELVARMRDAFSVARELERNMATSLSQSERLRQSIFKAAFEGELVPQDPSDEPAGRLLERVKAERAKSKGEKDTNSKDKSQLELSTYVK